MSRGTPKTLREACKNGIEDFYVNFACDHGAMDLYLANHVKDFLAQQFTTAMLKLEKPKADELNQLFMKCTKGVE
jgi:uncharacterized protein (DUF2237 family)